MRVQGRISLLAALIVSGLALAAPAAHAFGIEKFVAVNCIKEDCAEE